MPILKEEDDDLGFEEVYAFNGFSKYEDSTNTLLPSNYKITSDLTLKPQYIKKSVYEIKDMMDYNNYGGGVMLGTRKTIVKGHGSSKATAIYNCINQAYEMEKNNLLNRWHYIGSCLYLCSRRSCIWRKWIRCNFA